MAGDVSIDDLGKTALVPEKEEKRGAVNGSDGDVWREVEGLLGPY